MANKFLTIIFVLAALFFGTMAFTIARAQGTDGVTSAGCITVDQIVTDDILSHYKEHNGRIVEFKGQAAVTLLEAIDKAVGTKAPFTVDHVIVGIQDDETEIAFIKYFKDGCMQNAGRIPVDFITAFEKRV